MTTSINATLSKSLKAQKETPKRRGRTSVTKTTPAVLSMASASSSSSTSTPKKPPSALFRALQRVKKPTRSITTISELNEYANTDQRPTVELRVVDVVEPAVKKTAESIVHVFLCEAAHGESKKDMKEYGRLLSDILKSGQGMSSELCELLVRATVWQTKIENLNFEAGDMIRVANVSKVGTFRGMVQFNCSPEHIQKLH